MRYVIALALLAIGCNAPPNNHEMCQPYTWSYTRGCIGDYHMNPYGVCVCNWVDGGGVY